MTRPGARPVMGLDGVAWGSLLDCRGETGVVSLLLRTVGESDGGAWRQAVAELEERLVPRHSLNPAARCMRDATPAAVPFLVRLAQDRTRAAHDRVLDLVMTIADAVEQGPVEVCFGVWPEHWFEASARKLATSGVDRWFELLDEDRTWDRRRDVLRLLAIACRAGDGGIAGRLWQSAEHAPDAHLLAERLICLAYASAAPSHREPCEETWALCLRDWLGSPGRPSPQQTADATRIALDHLPWWTDGDTRRALGELVHEGLHG